MEEEKSTLSTSFLDVLSCGLGAAILQFLVFSVLPHAGMVRSGGPKDVMPGEARQLRQIGVLVEEKERAESLTAVVVLSFPLSGEENQGLSLLALQNAVVIRNVAPASLLSRKSKGGDLSAVEAFEVISAAGLRVLVMRLGISGGQQKGRPIDIAISHESIPVTGTCRMLVGNRELAPAARINSARRLNSRISVDFTNARIIAD